MIQAGIPTPSPDSIEVSLPPALEHWRDLYLHTAVQKLLVFVAVALVLYLLARVVRAQIGRQIEDVNRRHVLRKWVGYGYAALLFAFAIALFADSVAGLGTVLALLLAGIAVALQDILRSVVGWLYLSSRAGVAIGSRVEVGGVTGDVIDIGVLKTTLLEVGGALVFGRQSTGRLVTVPNYRMLADLVRVSGSENPFVWQEMRITVTYESDWRRAERILLDAAEELHAEIAPELHEGFQRLERRYAFKYGTLTPTVYVSVADSGVDLFLRFLVHVRRRRGSIDRIARRILTGFAAEPQVELAYPTQRIYRAGEEAARTPAPVEVLGSEPGGEGHGPPPDLIEE